MGLYNQGKDAMDKEPEKMMAVILSILKRGHDVQIRKKGKGYIVMEVRKEIRYRTDQAEASG